MKCGEWNLAPIEDRWEAVEECAELYEQSTERAGADAVAIARLNGLELVRLGKPASAELMTLRYAQRVQARKRRARAHRWIGGVAHVIGVAGSAVIGATLAGSTGLVLGLVAAVVAFELAEHLPNPVVLRVATGDGEWTELRRRQLRDVRLVPEDDEGWSLRLSKDLSLRGEAAVDAARYILPLLNRTGLGADDLRKARNYVAKKGKTLERLFAAAARRRGRRRTARLCVLDPHIRLGLEILASEESERLALMGDLRSLGQAWEHAAELAVIEDGLVYGPGITRGLAALKG